MMVWLLFIIDLMGLFFYNKIGSIISIGDLPTTNIIEPLFFDNFVSNQLAVTNLFIVFGIVNNLENGFKGNAPEF